MPHMCRKTPADLALQLQSVGARVRKNVMEGYSTHRYGSAPSSPTKPIQRAEIFSSANDILRDVYSSASALPPISPRKRAREDDADHEFVDSMAVDAEVEGTESDGETVIILDPRGSRPVKPKPRSRRALMQTQSLPSGLFGPPQGLLSAQDTGLTVLEPTLEHDWSMNGSSTLPQPPAFEPMVL
ncbi:hypothetical protein B0H10DRAFT_232302 [Mycena sp. CBHHK59/15]|nr:hypothetical protein B0H10DRAFT_232302 [Mycena sp. CBHHK59/15]